MLAPVVILGSLAIGALGYRTFEGLSWIDALLSASMILGGVGPVGPVKTTGGKLFASVDALYSKRCLARLDGSPHERPAVSLAILSCDFQRASLSNMMAQLQARNSRQTGRGALEVAS